MMLLISFSILGGAKAQQSFKKEYRVILCLPFNSKASSMNMLSEAMYDYYQGVKIALQDLEEEGLKIKLYVFDAAKDSQSITKMLNHPDVEKADLFIGPVFDPELQQVERYCLAKGIPLVSPLRFYKPLNSGSQVLNFFMHDSLKCMAIGAKAAKQFPNHQIYLVTDATPSTKIWADYLKKGLQLNGCKGYKTITMANYKFSGTAPKGDSIVYLSALSNIAHRSYLQQQIKNKDASWIIGHFDWMDNTITYSDFSHDFTLYPDVNYTNFEDSSTQQFRNIFREQFKGEPSKYAYIGNDQMKYLAYQLLSFGGIQTASASFAGNTWCGLINCITWQTGDSNTDLHNNISIHFLRINEGKLQTYCQ